MRKCVGFLVALAAFLCWFGADVPMDDDPIRLRNSGLL